jgi:hypothetical protein
MTSRIRVGPGIQSTHDISFNDGVKIYGAFLDGGPKGLIEGASVATSLLANRQGARFGNNDPSFSHVEQRSWVGGRAQESISDDATRYFDSHNCWTLSPNVLLPTLLSRYGKGLRTAYSEMPGDVRWQPLYGKTGRLARKFTAATATGLSVKELYIWLRKVGSPGDIYAGVYADDGGVPDYASPIKYAMIGADTITDITSFLGEFAFSSAGTLVDSTDYWIIVAPVSDDDAKHHWEVGYDVGATGWYYWNLPDIYEWFEDAACGIYYRLTDTDVRRTFIPFVLDNCHYFVTKNDDRSASAIYLAGDRGLVAAGATTTSITCTGKTWATNRWAGARVRICIGPGKGQTAPITSNTATALTLGAGLEITPTTDSHFQIYQTPWLTLISPTGGVSMGAVKSICVSNDIAFFANGVESADKYISQFAYHTDGTHKMYADTAAKADLVYAFYDTADGAQVYRAVNGDTTKTVGVSRGTTPAYGTSITFKTNIPCDDSTWVITGMIDFQNQLYVLKENCIGYIEADKWIKLNVGLDRIAELGNGAACAVQDLYLYLSWSHSVERLAGGTLDDAGPWQDAGMPQDRAGTVAWMEPIVAHMLNAVDAGLEGYSSVLAYNGMGFGEIYRAPVIGKRIRMAHWQGNPLGRHYLWTEVGGDLVYQVFPKDTLNPLRDDECEFVHEGLCISSTIDLDVAVLPKFFKALSCVSENLGGTTALRRVAVEYQMDEDVNTDEWIELGAMAASPEDSREMNQGNKRKMRWRARLLTEDADQPAKVRAIVVSGYAKVPPKRVWTMRLKLSTLARDALGAPTVNPTEFYKWLWNASSQAGGIFMHTKWENADSVWVVVEPPGLIRNMVNVMQKWWGGVATLVVREA